MDFPDLDSMRGGEPSSYGEKPPYGGRPKFVKLGPGDQGDNLPPSIYEDPRSWRATPGEKGEIHAWGIYPHERDNLPAFDGVAGMMRQMKYQMIYFHGLESPETQWVNAVMERNRKELENVDLKDLELCDVILKIQDRWIKNKEGKPRIWRRIRVSGGIKLSAFQDKVIAPAMGWVRNFHCYTYTDFRDGTLYGPQESNAIDRMHSALIGYDWLPDDKYMLAHIFSKEGDKFGYLYDFGDKWYHDISVEKIIPHDESDGRVEILGGAGMCPGENMNGSISYHDFLEEFDKAKPARKVEQKREILSQPNYKAFGKPPSLFDPDMFDQDAAEERLRQALGSTNSVRSGAKVFTMPIAPGAQAMGEAMSKAWLKKGQKITHKKERGESYGYWTETVGQSRDRRGESVCSGCGKPGGMELKPCGGCKVPLYCCREHQVEHWKVHKKECSRKHLPKDD